MRSSVKIALLLVLAITIPMNGLAQERSVTLLGEGGYPYLGSGYTLPGGTMVIQTHVAVRVAGYLPVRSVWFALPTSECMPGASIDVWSPYAVEGSLETGVTIDFGECLDPPIEAMTIYVSFLMPSDTCCAWVFEPHEAAASLRVAGTDCNGDTVVVVPWGGTFNFEFGDPIDGCGVPTIPQYPFPPDGAVDQPLDATLDWFTQTTAGTNLGVFIANIHFGTTPTPPVYIWNVDAWLPQTVGPLQPNTTYYWKVRSIASDFGWVDSPMWSFTTTDGVPVEGKTWGQIKAMMKKKE